MKCVNCGHENRATAKFCEECGQPLVLACTKCGAGLSSTAKFCPECGQPSHPQTTGAPDLYTPKHLLEKILSSRIALEGERKQVTLLFADVQGSMGLFAVRDPEEARQILDPVIEHMMEAVHHYEGTVNHVLGDGIVALFGAPLAHEDHAIRACHAALRMQDRVKRYAERVQQTQGSLVQIRVGLNSGEVIVRSIGSDLRMDYTVVGQTANIAARMEQMAAPGTVLISAGTAALAEGYIQVKSLGPTKVKGVDLPLEVLELQGATAVRSRLHAKAGRGLTRFVGRHGELRQLVEALRRAESGHGQVVAVMGEPGVGKSRLCWEFIRSPATRGWLTIESGSVSFGKPIGFLPIADLLRSLFRIESSDSAEEIRAKAEAVLAGLDAGLAPSLPALLWLLEVPVDDAEWQRLEPPQRRQQALEAVKRLLLRQSQAQPLLILFEDLHWIDADTQAMLDALVAILPTARLLLLVNYRPEYRHSWGGKTYYHQLSVGSLSSESATELLETVLGTDSNLETVKRLLIERTEGNPFFLEESVRTLVETGALTGVRGAHRLARPTESFCMPATAQAMLAARIDRLAEEDKRLLLTASVIGRDMSLPLLKEVVEQSEEELRESLSRLQAAEFLYETGLPPDVNYTFKHALTHDVTYGSILQARRRALDARIVEALERLHGDRIGEHIERLAHHAFRGEVWNKALLYSRQAGIRAFTRSSNREAVVHFEQALTALSHLPETSDTLEAGIEVRIALRRALWPLGRFEEGFRHLRDSESLAEGLGNRLQLGWIAAYMSEHIRQTGHAADAPAFAERALAIAEGLCDSDLKVAANYYLGTAYFVAGDYRRTDEYFGTILALLPNELFRERCGLAGFPAVMSRMFWPLALAERGEFARGLAEAEEAVRLAKALDHPYSLICAMRAVGRVHGAKADYDRALPVAQQSLALTRECNLPQLFPEVADLLGHLYCLVGRIPEALALLEDALAALEAMGMFQWRSSVLVHLGEAELIAGRPDEAVALANRCLALTRERGHRGYEAWSLRLLGEIAAHPERSDPTAAEAHYASALALASELAMRPLVAQCHAGLGRICAGVGREQEACDHSAAAAAIYSDLHARESLQRT